MKTFDFLDLMAVDSTQWSTEVDPIGLLAYQSYKRRHQLDEADFLSKNTKLVSVEYDHKKERVKLVRRHWEKWPIFISMSPESYKKMSASKNITRWVNQQIKAGTIKDTDKDNEYKLQEDLGEAEQLDEVLTLQQRMKRKILMRRLAPRIDRARKIAMRRRAGIDVLKRRANALARRTMAKKLAGGKNKADLSTSERGRIEKILAKRKAGIDRLAVRLLPKVRKAQSQRFAAKKPTPTPTPAPAKPPADDNK